MFVGTVNKCTKPEKFTRQKIPTKTVMNNFVILLCDSVIHLLSALWRLYLNAVFKPHWKYDFLNPFSQFSAKKMEST